MSDDKCESKMINIEHDHVWNHFKFHASQRVVLFRFYVLFVTFFLAGMGFLLVRFPYKSIMHEISGVLFSLLFIVITFVFHCLDLRNRQLISYARESLKSFEDKYFPEDSENDYLALFRCDDKNKKKSFLHSTCYNAIFIAGYMVAVVFILISVYVACYYQHAA